MIVESNAMTDNEITYQIRGAIFDVYNALGPGLLESVYEEALFFELEQRGLKVERQKLVPINYKGNIWVYLLILASKTCKKESIVSYSKSVRSVRSV